MSRTLSPYSLENEDDSQEIEIQIVNPEAVSIETPDGGAIIILGEDASEDLCEDFGDNLALSMTKTDLSGVGQDLLNDFSDDEGSRKDWERTYKKGLDLLGLKIEDRSTPWPGACGVFHPILSEAAVRFQSQAIMETFPAGGPVKTKIIGHVTPEKERQALRIKTDLNYFLTERMSEYRSEHERMLFSLPLAGAAFKKVYFDSNLKRPVSMYVPAEDMVVPYGATDLQSCPRYTHIMRKFPNEVRKLQVAGFYRDISLPDMAPEISDIQRGKDELTGEDQLINDDRHVLLEFHVDYDLPGFEDKIENQKNTDDNKNKNGEPSGIALPYVITIDKQSGEVLSIYRNWRQDDENKLKRQHFVPYSYIPGFGFYAFGLIHLIGGIAKSATSILRQLVDAGTLSNLPAGLKARGLRIKGDSSPLMPGEFRDVDVPSGAIKDAIYMLPYKEPSQVLAGLLASMIEEGRRFASIADLQIGDANQQAPVGTTLALMERAMKVMSAVQARLHASMKQELDLLVDIIKHHMEGDYEYETEGNATRTKDYDDKIDVFPVTDPNAASLSQRVMQYQAALQLSAQAPQMYDLPELHRQMLTVLGIEDVEKIIPDTKNVKPKDPVSENMDILNNKPVKAFLYQDHEAHIQVHMSAAQDPKVMALVGQSPQASVIQAAGTAHLMEHIAFQYRKEIEKQLGVELPPVNESMSEDMEIKISKLSAAASSKLLQKDKAEAQMQQQQQQQQDPIMQLNMAELELQKADLILKSKKVDADIVAKKQQLLNDQERIASQERISVAAAQQKEIKDELDRKLKADKNAAEMKLKGMQFGHDSQHEKDLSTAKMKLEGMRFGREIINSDRTRNPPRE